MISSLSRCLVSLALASIAMATACGETTVMVEHRTTTNSTNSFRFASVESPVQNDVGANGEWSIVSGTPDPAGGGVEKLNDGFLPHSSDQPSENFFFAPATEGGRLLLDLNAPVELSQIRSYSWHPGERADQVYRVFASDGSGDSFQLEPDAETDPLSCGWLEIASVDTRIRGAEVSRGGQYAVRISASSSTIGRYRYLLFDVKQTQPGQHFSNTFFSEIDVLGSASQVKPAVPAPVPGIQTYSIQDGKYQVTIDTSQCPDLTRWTKRELVPVIRQWYPEIVDRLPSENYHAPAAMRINFSASMDGVAATGGTTVYCSGNWFRRNLQGEAKGAIVHELVHVVQQYGAARRSNPNAQRTPGWVVEGIADYIRWHLYEPASARGGVGSRHPASLRYDASYRDTASFLAWVIANEAPDLLQKLNAAARQGKYTDEFWRQTTGKLVTELAEAWQQDL